MRETHRLSADPWRADLPRLRIFEAVARERSFTTAARSLGLSQPAVSRAVAALEAHLGARLLERRGRDVTLTEAGEGALASARRVRDALDDLSATIAGRRQPSGDFVCFAAEHVASHLLAAPVARLLAEFPAVVPRVLTAPAQLAVPEIAEDRAELGFFFKVEAHAKLELRPIATFPCQLVAHPAATAATLATFIGSREVDDRRTRSFPTVDMLRKKRPETTIRLSSNSLALHKVWAAAKVGVTILPRFVVAEELHRGSLRVVHPEWVYEAELVAVVRRGRVLSTLSRRMLQEVRARCRELGGKPSKRG